MAIISTRITGTTETVLSTKPCKIWGVYANAASTGNVTLRDAVAIGGSAVWTLAGAVYSTGDNADFHGAITETGLTSEGSAAGTVYQVLYEPIT